MTSFEKIAVSLPAQAAESVSAYVAAVIEQRAKLDDLAVLLDEMLAGSGGPLTAAERRATDRALGIATKRSARKAR